MLSETDMDPGILRDLFTQGLFSQTDPTRLHAELWADYMSKVMTTWLPMLMATVLVGRDLFGAGTQCFPVNLTHTQPGTNMTSADNTSYAPKPVLNEISDYSRQLAEYVNVYCAQQDHYQSSTMFSYQLFTIMLVIQAGVLYAPMLLWNVTTARKILCHLRFLLHDTDLLYHRHRGDQEARGGYEQSELVKNVNIWIKHDSLYKHYMMKQLVTTVCLGIFITIYCTIPSLTASNIHDEFLCSVKDRFTVDCAVPSATVHRCVWFTNLVLLFLNVSCIVGHVVTLRYNHFYGTHQPFRELGITLDKPPLNDAHLIHMFLRANIESNDKYNYVKVLEDVVSENDPSMNTTNTAYSVRNETNSPLDHSPSLGPTRRQYICYESGV
ncbi:pannexin-2-like [Branchiostoma floridae]|uniref:Pannexin-2-like n=1 Tax=Branchiostoma floridae TaxID=7739 RepID=A0A9J7HJ13_BRAFL|nr:pannexin-2-like [Branchiostoma floridae]